MFAKLARLSQLRCLLPSAARPDTPGSCRQTTMRHKHVPQARYNGSGGRHSCVIGSVRRRTVGWSVIGVSRLRTRPPVERMEKAWGNRRDDPASLLDRYTLPHYLM